MFPPMWPRPTKPIDVFMPVISGPPFDRRESECGGPQLCLLHRCSFTGRSLDVKPFVRRVAQQPAAPPSAVLTATMIKPPSVIEANEARKPATTATAGISAVRYWGIRNGSVCRTPLREVPTPVIDPRTYGLPWPVRSPMSESPSENVMLTPAPIAVARLGGLALAGVPVGRGRDADLGQPRNSPCVALVAADQHTIGS